MNTRLLGAVILCLAASVSLSAQVSKDAKFKILGTVIAEQAEARIAMPFGMEGVEVNDEGEINQKKVESEIKKHGQAIEAGRIVTITAIDFADDKIELELDGGGKNKKAWYDRIEVGVGSTTTPIDRKDESKAKGSKIVLKFAKKVPPEITPDHLHELLMPVLDFNKHNFMTSGVEALPPEFQQAIKEKEAKIGMDRGTVILAMGRPDRKSYDKDSGGAQQETWIYYGRGKKATFVWFQNDVVIKVEAF
jgi:hypothetical protein